MNVEIEIPKQNLKYDPGNHATYRETDRNMDKQMDKVNP